MAYAPNVVKAQVLYNNVIRRSDANTAFIGTYVEGFDPSNAYDWRDFTEFVGVGDIRCLFSVSTATADCVVVWFGASGVDVNISISVNGGSSWGPVATVPFVANTMKWINIGPQTFNGLKISCSSQTRIRQVVVGNVLQFPVGQWQEISPPTLIQGLVFENQTSINGSIIGRNIRRYEKSGQISLDRVTQEWVRSSWADFQSFAARTPFFYRWHPTAYPNDVAFAVADSLPGPKNASPPPLMHCEMPIRFITE